MPKRTFTAEFTVDIDASTRRTFPEGWSGDVDDEIAEAADKAGVTGKAAPKKGKAEAADKAGEPAPEGDAAP